MGPNQIGAQHLKQWADKYPYKAAIKGSYVTIRPKRIIVCSNYSISECYNETDSQALKRRFQVTYWMYTHTEQVQQAALQAFPELAEDNPELI